MFLKRKTNKYTEDCYKEIERLRCIFDKADTVLIGAGAGLSASAGFTYTGERFYKYFSDFEEKYDFHDMYGGGFYPYETSEEYWAYWSRYIWINRYMEAPKPVYQKLLNIIKDKNYFVITTNVDHCFQKSGCDKQRLFYTQGDYGLFQCSEPCHMNTYDNKEQIQKMLEAQGFIIGEDNTLLLQAGVKAKAVIPKELLPHCPVCGREMSVNLRADQTFVEDEGWHKAAKRYGLFLKSHENSEILYVECGVGYNTPGIIKYPFWEMTYKNPKSVFVCLNYGEAVCPNEIRERSVCIEGDICNTLSALEEEIENTK